MEIAKLKESIASAERETLDAPQRRILDALAWWESITVVEPTRTQVAFAAGYTVSGHFNNMCGKMKGLGLIRYPSGSRLAITEEGKELAEYPDVIPTAEELQHRVRKKLNDPQKRIFNAVVNHWPEAISREELAESCDYAVSGHFNNMCGKLRSLGIVRYPGGGTVIAEDMLFIGE